jgi:transcriptional regulator with XRE-family HTH domain
MNKTMVEWFVTQFRQWESETGSHQTITSFGEYLGLSQPTISAYMRGTRTPSKETAKQIAERLNNFKILDILGYSRPSSDSLAQLPPILRAKVEAALIEINSIYQARGIEINSAEAEAIADSVFSRIGLIKKSNSRPESGSM